jgi:CRISPR-associated protein Csm4
MMETYRATLRPQAALRSPWQADMLFGHLCWLIRYQEGEAALNTFLEPYRQGEPPLLFSDGFPQDWLPRPVLPPRTESGLRSKAESIAALQAAKEAKTIRWVRPAEFAALRAGQPVTLDPLPAMRLSRTVLKNQINRLTGGTTPQQEETVGGGNLYSLEELTTVQTTEIPPVPLDVSLYVRAADAAWAERARQLLADLALGGYGAKKSAGYGAFALVGWERFTEFDGEVPGANGFISLSNWVPARSDPTDGFYKLLVKYGKLGEEFAHSENPFKFPLVLLAAGASFYAETPIREWYGRLVTGIAPANEKVVQYGYAFAVPAYLTADPAEVP